VLASPSSSGPKRRRPADGRAGTPSSFFKSTRGKVTLALMGAGVGLTLWSIQHDREAGQVSHPLVSEKGMSHMQKVFRTAAALLLAATVAAPVFAQSLTGSITGSIKDEQGAVLPGVTVTLTGKQGAKTQVTDSSGVYRFPALEVGTYDIVAELSGFAKATRTAIAISPGNELAVDLSLKVAGVAESVIVTGDSPIVDVKSSATQTTISQSLLFSAPITRTAINVINYAPGVNSSSAYGGGPAPATRCSSTASTRATRAAARPGPSTTTTSSRNTSSRASARRRIRRLHRRGGQHDHQVGRQPLQRLFDFFGSNRAWAATTSRLRSRRPTRRWPTRQDHEVRRHHRRSSAGRSSRTSVLLRKRAALPAGGRPDGRRHRAA
jgi:hypothetical protein